MIIPIVPIALPWISSLFCKKYSILIVMIKQACLIWRAYVRRRGGRADLVRTVVAAAGVV